MTKSIVLLGTFDTKGPEFSFIKQVIEARGLETCLVDVGILGKPGLSSDISSEEVAKKGGASLQSLIDKNDRGEAINVMMEGAARVVEDLYNSGQLDGIISLGGSGGTVIATHAMRSLAVGVPKVMVSTVASGDTRPYVGEKDITMMYSVVDIAGINRISAEILKNAAGAICGMVEAGARDADFDEKPLIAASMFGVTTPCVDQVREMLEKEGYEILVFHATGTGGQAMEGLIKDGYIKGVIDITTTELADELVGGVLSAGPDRLEAAGDNSIPQVVSLGALDMVNFWAIDTVPERYKNRTLYKHNPNVTLMRTTAEENIKLGEVIADKLNQSKGKTALMIPLKGISAIDQEGQPFHDLEADTALFNVLRDKLSDKVELVEVDAHINDPAFASALVTKLIQYLR